MDEVWVKIYKSLGVIHDKEIIKNRLLPFLNWYSKYDSEIFWMFEILDIDCSMSKPSMFFSKSADCRFS